MGCDRPSAHGGRGAWNHPAYCIGQAGRHGGTRAGTSAPSRRRRTRVSRDWVIGGVTASDRRPDSGRNHSNPAARQVSRSPDFNYPAAVARAPGLTVRRGDRRYSENSLKSADSGPARFHRFQEIQSIRSTPSTAGLYDLYTRCGRTVDKKGTFPSHQNYPQDPPQA